MSIAKLYDFDSPRKDIRRAPLSAPCGNSEDSFSSPGFLSSFDLLCKIIVELSGVAVFAGAWPAIPSRSEPLVLFNSVKTGATLGCLLSELSAERVRAKVAASDAAFDAPLAVCSIERP